MNEVDPRLTEVMKDCREAVSSDFGRIVNKISHWQSYSEKFWIGYFATYCRNMTLDHRMKILFDAEIFHKWIGAVASDAPGIEMEKRRELAKLSESSPLFWLRKIDAGNAATNGGFII